MKKVFYISSFAFLGLIVSTLIHAGLEMLALKIIFENPETYAGTFWWQEWHMIHAFFSALLWFLGFGFGVHFGIKFWEPYGSKSGFLGFGK